MDRPTSTGQASARRAPLLRLGTKATALFIISLCLPLVWHAHLLQERLGSAASLAGLPPLELMLALGLLALPFVVLRLLRIDWQAGR